MADNRDEHAYGTAPPDGPVSRADFERAVRALNMSDLDLHDAVIKLGARLVALTDELTRRLDGVEPLPAAPNTPAPPPSATVEMATEAAMESTLATIRASDIQMGTRVSLDLGGSKYAAQSPDIPCAELLSLCHARCCMLSFALSTEDLDEGVIRWDYGQPYLIRQRASDGYCVHNHPDGHACTVHAQRPRVCRSYDCRKDARIWVDYEQRIPAPFAVGAFYDRGMGNDFELLERAKRRALAIRREAVAISETYADAAPRPGPKPEPAPKPDPESRPEP
jgi:Fe-S-cluster containining protein